MLDSYDFESLESNGIITKNYLYNRVNPEIVNSKIVIKNNWSYILVSDRSFITSNEPGIFTQFDWFYQPEINDQNSNNLYEEEIDMFGWHTSFLPPEKKNVEKFHIWLYSGVSVNYVKGHSIIHCEGTFEYQ